MDEKKEKKKIDDESLDQVTGGQNKEIIGYWYMCPDCKNGTASFDPNIKVCPHCQSTNIYMME